MSIETLTIGDPFFGIQIIKHEASYKIEGKTIALNLSEKAMKVREQKLGTLQSAIMVNTELRDVAHAVVITGFTDHEDDMALMTRIRATWSPAFAVRNEERLRNAEHYMSDRVWDETFGFTLYHSASVPLDVGLHREHPFCPVPGFREVHTQIVGFGKMQQCSDDDVNTLYLEDLMAPGNTHRPMYDAAGNYPWHQYETITPSVFMVVEMLPEGITPPD